MVKKEILQVEIEKVREQLNRALSGPNDVDTYYALSVKLDGLIERYIEIAEQEEQEEQTEEVMMEV